MTVISSWTGRNKVNVGEQVCSVDEIIHKALLFSSEPQQEVAGAGRHGSSKCSDDKRWIPPPLDVLKINSDGAFRQKEQDGAWGFVIRDSDGHGLLAGAGRLPAVHDALSAEAEACLAALSRGNGAGHN